MIERPPVRTDSERPRTRRGPDQVAGVARQTLRGRGGMRYVVSREDLISSKRAAGRPVDLEDVRLLELKE